MSDQFWANIRYVMVAIGTGLVVKYFGNVIGADQAAAIVGPVVDVIIGLMVGGGAIAWGNYVKAGTKAVPAAVAAKPDIPTVSSVTGQVVG